MFLKKRIILIVKFFSSLKGDIMNYFSLLIAVLQDVTRKKRNS